LSYFLLIFSNLVGYLDLCILFEIIFSLYTQTLLPTSNSSLLQKKKKTMLSCFTDSRRHVKIPLQAFLGVISVATYMDRGLIWRLEKLPLFLFCESTIMQGLKVRHIVVFLYGLVLFFLTFLFILKHWKAPIFVWKP
jgi:hypothetical protein